MRSKRTKVLVHFYFMRHGKKEGDALTSEGVEQIWHSAKNNLKGIHFDRCFSSLMGRALRTVVTALSSLGQLKSGSIIQAREDLNFEGAPGLENFKTYEAEVKRRKDVGEAETVALWRKVAPTYVNFMRRKLTKSLKAIAMDMTFVRRDNAVQKVYNVLVGSHSPKAELAALEPGQMPMLREADLVRYTVEVSFENLGLGEIHSDIKARIIASEYLSRGF